MDGKTSQRVQGCASEEAAGSVGGAWDRGPAWAGGGPHLGSERRCVLGTSGLEMAGSTARALERHPWPLTPARRRQCPSPSCDHHRCPQPSPRVPGLRAAG